jgi:hypothetical protein
VRSVVRSHVHASLPAGGGEASAKPGRELGKRPVCGSGSVR